MSSAELLAAEPGACRKLSGRWGHQVLTYVDDASFVRFSQIKAESNMMNLAAGSVFKNTQGRTSAYFLYTS